MKPEANHPQETGTRPGRLQRFDLASWLNWAERYGYRVYLSDTAKRGRLRVVTEAPKGPRSAEDVALWHAFQGSPKQSKANRTALIAYLVRAGRCGPTGSDTRSMPRARPTAGSR
jgi:hypothetical protein